MSENEHGGPRGPHKHPNIRPARGTPNLSEGRTLQGYSDNPNKPEITTEEEKIAEFNRCLKAISQSTGLPKDIILKAVGLTSDHTPPESLKKWLEGQMFAHIVTERFLKQARLFFKQPQEVIEIAKTEKWIK